MPEQFRKRDINAVGKNLGIKPVVDMAEYNETSRKNHRDTILSISGWKLPSHKEHGNLVDQARWYIEQQLSPKKVLESLVEYCWHNKIVIPSFSKLAEIITNHYNHYEDQLLDVLAKQLNDDNKLKLDKLFVSSDSKPYERPPITLLRHINQSVPVIYKEMLCYSTLLRRAIQILHPSLMPSI